MHGSGQAKAERLIQETLHSEGLSDQHLVSWRQGYPFKTNLAAKLQAQAIVTVNWIAERLNMGGRGHLMHLLYRNGKDTAPP